MTAGNRTPEAEKPDRRCRHAAIGWIVWPGRHARPILRLSRADRPIGTWLLLLPCWWGCCWPCCMTGGGMARPVDIRGVRHRGRPDARRGLHLERHHRPPHRRRRRAHRRSRPIPAGAGNGAARWPGADGAGAGGFLHPADLQHRWPSRWACCRWLPVCDLSFCQAVHVVAAGLSRAGLQLGRACWPGRRIPGGWSWPRGPLPGGHRVDAFLRHDLCPSGRGGRRADRGEIDRAAFRRGERRAGCAAFLVGAVQPDGGGVVLALCRATTACRDAAGAGRRVGVGLAPGTGNSRAFRRGGRRGPACGCSAPTGMRA